MSPEEQLIAALRSAAGENLVVITGAGISLASGLPTFRGSDPEAIWSRDVTEIATVAFFRRDPVVWWRWFDLRFGRIHGRGAERGSRGARRARAGACLARRTISPGDAERRHPS